MKDMKPTTTSWGKLGGSGKMHSFAPTGTQTPDRTSQEGHSGSRKGIEPQAGGQVGFYSDNAKRGREMSQKHGSNVDYAGPQEAGTSGPCKVGGDKNGFAKGGSTHMWGNRGSIPAKGGQTGP